MVEDSIGRKRQKTQPGATNKAFELCNGRRELRKNKHSNNKNQVEYQHMNKNIRQNMTEDKEHWLYQKCFIVDLGWCIALERLPTTRKAFTKTETPPMTVIPDKMIYSTVIVMMCWKDGQNISKVISKLKEFSFLIKYMLKEERPHIS